MALSSPSNATKLAMKRRSNKDASPLRRLAADALMRARKLPVGHDRNDLRQLAMGLLWLEKKNLQATVQDRISAMLAMTELRRGTSVIDPAPTSVVPNACLSARGQSPEQGDGSMPL